MRGVSRDLNSRNQDAAWPPELIQPFLEDCFNNRSWVDDTSRLVREFVANIVTVFETNDAIALNAKRYRAANIDVRMRYPDVDVSCDACVIDVAVHAQVRSKIEEFLIQSARHYTALRGTLEHALTTLRSLVR
jgi:hypothetical protein